MIKTFFIALQFLTRLPSPTFAKISETEIARSQYYYPAVGFVIGFLLLTLQQIISFESHLLSAAIVLSAWILLTGALHLDGLADCTDAWVGGYGDKEKSLRIMKDPQSGPVAVVFVVMLLIIKLTALDVIIAHDDALALILACVLPRLLLPLFFLTTPYLREQGLGSALANHQSKSAAVIMAIITCLVLLILATWVFIISLLAVLALFWFIRRLAIQRLQGFTGDVAGAFVELAEALVLIIIVSLY